MKKIIVFLLISVLFVFVTTAQQSLSILGDDDYPPFSFEEDGELTGIDIDILNELFNRMNIDVEIELVPWNRLMALTKQGAVDGSFALFKTAEREEFCIYPEAPVHYSTFSVFVRQGNGFNFNSIQDLYGKTVGIPSGFTISDEFDLAKAQGLIAVEEVQTSQHNIRKLLAGRIDCFVANRLVTLYSIQQMGLAGQLVPLNQPIKEDRGAYFVLSSNSALAEKDKFIENYNVSLNEMYRDGTVQRILDAYKD